MQACYWNPRSFFQPAISYMKISSNSIIIVLRMLLIRRVVSKSSFFKANHSIHTVFSQMQVFISAVYLTAL